MKHILLLVVVLLTFTAANGQVSKHGNLKVNNTNLVDSDGNKVVLRGTSFGWSNWYGKFYNREAVAWLAADFKVSVVRAAMGVEPNDGYLSNPQKQMALVEEVVEACIANDIYVIIDWHSHGIRTEEACSFFALMATKYGKYPNVIYEIFNEPVRQSWDEVKDYSLEVIKTIRAIDPDNIILVGNTHWDQDVDIAADKPLEGNLTNIMYTLHFYAGTHKDKLIKRADYALSKGLPLFVSECAAMNADGDGAIDVESWTKWVNWMENNSISWVCWSVSSKNETCSMITDDSVAASGNWSENELKEWGRMVRGQLRIEN